MQTDLDDAEDDDLLERMLRGDEAALLVLYRRRQGGVYRFALRMSGSEAAAEDVTQEVFLTLMREGGRYDRSRGSVATYLYGIARNHVLRWLDRNRSDVPLAQESSNACPVPGPLIASDDPLGAVTRREVVEAVRQAVLALPPRYREVIVLCELEEMDYQAAADVLGCALGTVRSRLHRARALLTDKLRSSGAITGWAGKPDAARCAT